MTDCQHMNTVATSLTEPDRWCADCGALGDGYGEWILPKSATTPGNGCCVTVVGCAKHGTDVMAPGCSVFGGKMGAASVTVLGKTFTVQGCEFDHEPTSQEITVALIGKMKP